MHNICDLICSFKVNSCSSLNCNLRTWFGFFFVLLLKIAEADDMTWSAPKTIFAPWLEKSATGVQHFIWNLLFKMSGLFWGITCVPRDLHGRKWSRIVSPIIFFHWAYIKKGQSYFQHKYWFHTNFPSICCGHMYSSMGMLKPDFWVKK